MSETTTPPAQTPKPFKKVEEPPIVEIRDLVFHRGDRAIFNGLNLTVQPGHVVAIMGPSGTGKTTLLKLIGGQLKPDSGEILFEGHNVHQQSRKKLYAMRQKMGMMFQSGALLTDLNTFDNVAFPLREHTRLSASMIRDMVLMKLNAVGLRGARDLMPSELSGGMARRVAMARAIALDPEFMMYDEPFTGQDPISMGIMVKLVRELNDALNLTSILVSHDIHEALSIADYVYVISNGVVVGEGDTKSVTNSDSPWLNQFIKGEPDGPVPFHFPANDITNDILEQQA
jgi:phospholipid/cholesterol/gamma-HCH transport system ATP-binding protein